VSDSFPLPTERAETGLSLRLRKFFARISKAAIQAVADRRRHAALRAKVGCAQEAGFAKFGILNVADGKICQIKSSAGAIYTENDDRYLRVGQNHNSLEYVAVTAAL